jgi:hypothetical protein
MRRLYRIAAAPVLTVVVMALLVGGCGDDPHHVAPSDGDTVVRKNQARSGFFSDLPDVCGLARPELPKSLDAASFASDRDTLLGEPMKACYWHIANDVSARNLEVKTTAYAFDDYDRGFSSTLQEGISFCHAAATDKKLVSGLGSMAYSMPCSIPDFNEFGFVTVTSDSYSVGGAAVVVRYLNVVVSVRWVGGDYADRETRFKKGTVLPYQRTEEEAVAMARAIVTGLSKV